MDQSDKPKFTYSYEELQRELNGQLPDIIFSDDNDDGDSSGGEDNLDFNHQQFEQPIIRDGPHDYYNFDFNFEDEPAPVTLSVIDEVSQAIEVTETSQVGNDSSLMNGTSINGHSNEFSEDVEVSRSDWVPTRPVELPAVRGNAFSQIHSRVDRGISTDEVNGNYGATSLAPATEGSENSGKQDRLFFGMESVEKEEEARAKYLPQSRFQLSFGTRGEVDLDEFLSDYPIKSSRHRGLFEFEHHHEVACSPDAVNDKSILEQLIAVSKQYEQPKSTSGPIPFGRPNSAGKNELKTEAPASSSSTQFARHIPLRPSTSPFPSEKAEQSILDSFGLSSRADTESHPTVFLDLRNTKPSGIVLKKEVVTSSTETETHQLGRASVGVTAAPSPESDESSDEGSMDSGLWLDRFRQAKIAKAKALEEAKHKKADISTLTTSCKGDALKTSCRLKDALVTTEVSTDVEVIHGSAGSSVKRTQQDDEQDKPSDHVLKKIAEIKHKEHLLMTRRKMGRQLFEQRPKGMDSTTPVLFHEEASFEQAACLLDAPPPHTTILTIHLRSSYELLTITSNRHPVPLDHNPETSLSYIALLSWLLSLSSPAGTIEGDAPFHTAPLHITDMLQWSDPNSNLIQVTVHCKPMGHLLPSFLQTSNLRDLCSAGLIPVALLPRVSSEPLSSFIKMGTTSSSPTSSSSPPPTHEAGFFWSRLHTDERSSKWPLDRQLDIDTSVVTVTNTKLLAGAGDSRSLFSLLHAFQEEGLDLAGFKLGKREQQSQGGGALVLALAVRGHEALKTVRRICGPGINAVFTGLDGWTCSRFQQTVDRDLTTWFGPRLSPQCDFLATLPSTSATSHLVFSQPNDLLLLISPACPDVGWCIHVATATKGLQLVGCTRLTISPTVSQQLGLGKGQASVFAGGICHLLVLRYENVMQHATSLVKACHSYLIENSGSAILHASYLFYAMPCVSKVIEILKVDNMHQLPNARETGLPDLLAEPPYPDCETLSFVLVVSEDHADSLSQILDQCSHHDLLALKCLPYLPPEHRNLLEKEFSFCLPAADSGHRLSACLLVLRGFHVHQTLGTVQDNLKTAKNVLFAFTVSNAVTHRFITSFFAMEELQSEPKRRLALQFTPAQHRTYFDRKALLEDMQNFSPDLESCLSVRVGDDSQFLSLFLALWKSLDLEGFSLEFCTLKTNRNLVLVVKRANAVFKLLEFTRNNRQSLTLSGVPSALEEAQQIVNDLSAEINETNSANHKYVLSPSKPDYDEVNILLLGAPLLLPAKHPQHPSSVAVLDFLHSRSFKVIGLRQFNIEGDILQRIQRVKINNFDRQSITEGGQYLAVLFVGRLAAMATRDLMRGDDKLISIIKQNGKYIFLSDSIEESLNCAGFIFDSILPNPTLVVQ